MIYKLPDVQAGFRKGRGTRDQIANISWIIEKVTEFQKHIYFCFINYAEAFDCEAVFFVFVFVFLFFCFFHKKLWKILQEVGIQDHLDCLLKNLYADQEAKLETDMEQQTGSK